ncbi:hypothetical protein [Nannocystis bainbridge]|uniref:Uncharacterized protein n=1 Tax=Nannocystis bainbridge TaxID=2995303 RepID=A0ABT5E3C8_9BACT|nr:hypothetical protein [Nannocystis bainbridge]MDC0719938.1 hypothetical protein [Nannocystis bainbridge]
MPARAALVSLVLAGPGLAAPPVSPLSPESDNAAIFAAIVAADPASTTTPASVEALVAAATLAEKRLAVAEDADAVAELLMYAGAARRLAAQRVPGDARLHLCAMLADAELVLQRSPPPPAEVADPAGGLKAEALDGLKDVECPPAVAVQPEPQKEPAPEGPAAPPASPPPPRPSVARLAVGGTLAGLTAPLVVGMAASLVARRNAGEDIDAINAAYTGAERPPTDAELAAGVEANDRYRRLGPLALGLGLAAGASLAAGLAVLLARPRAHSRARLRATGAALVYQF